MSSFFRFLVGSLSCIFINNLSKYNNLDLKLKADIKKKLSNLKKNITATKTHKIFNTKLINILLSEKLSSFLRFQFVQKMFFVHNRLFILKELNQLRSSDNWKFYKKLIIEDNAGNPIRYIFYPFSSGNRIHQVYHLHILNKNFQIDLKKINTILELGGGYGLLARIFSLINKSVKYTIFDTFIVNLLQYYYLEILKLKTNFSKKKKINFYLINKIKDLKFNNKKFLSDLFIANWSLSEFPLKYRNRFIKFIFQSKLILISFQEKFEDIDNLKYFTLLKDRLSKRFIIKIIKNKYYYGNFFKKHNHYYFIAKLR
jgi:hypothetical protein